MVFLLFAAAFIAVFCVPALACTTVVVGRAVSPSGRVIVGHNEDDSGRIVNRHGFVPAADHKDGEFLPAEPGLAVIQQARHTHGFYWSEMKRADGGLTSADSFYNDQGVVIVSDSCADSKEDADNPSLLTDGGVGYNLRRILAERASSARDAVEIAARLIDRYGYVGSGRCYTVADADEAWMLQVVRGKHYAARRICDNEVALIPNYYTIHDVDADDHENFILSPDLIEYAQSRAWYSPEDGTFDFAKAYQSEKTRHSEGNRLRSSGGYSILTRKPYVCDEDYPFAVTPTQPVGQEQVMEVLRSHYEGTPNDPAWARMKLSGGSPHDSQIRRICTHTTVESFVLVFGERKRPESAVMWLSPGRPCELPYFPFHPALGVPSAFDTIGADSSRMLSEHILPDAALTSWHGGAWQKTQDFQNLFELLYQEHKDSQRQWLWAFENSLAQELESVHAQIFSAGALTDSEQAREILKKSDEQACAVMLDALTERSKDLHAVIVTVVPSRAAMDSDRIVALSFDLDDTRRPAENSIVITLGGTSALQHGIRPIRGSLKKQGARWIFAIKAQELLKAGTPGTFDYWLGGRDTTMRSFGGKLLFTFTKQSE